MLFFVKLSSQHQGFVIMELCDDVVKLEPPPLSMWANPSPENYNLDKF